MNEAFARFVDETLAAVRRGLGLPGGARVLLAICAPRVTRHRGVYLDTAPESCSPAAGPPPAT